MSAFLILFKRESSREDSEGFEGRVDRSDLFKHFVTFATFP